MVEEASNPELSRERETQAAKDRIMVVGSEVLQDGNSMDFKVPVFGDSDFEEGYIDLLLTPSGIATVPKWTYKNGGVRQPETIEYVSAEFYLENEELLTGVLSKKLEKE